MTTYYVDGAVGSDGNLGTSEGAGNAWATIDKAMNTVAAGDHVYVKASVNYNELATIDTVGNSTAAILFSGYSTTPGDNGMVTIDAQSTRDHCIDTALTTSIYYLFENFVFTNGVSHNFEGVLSADSISFYNCRFSNSGGYGVRGDNWWKFINCEFLNNTQGPCDMDTDTDFVACVFHGNGNYPVAANAEFYRCQFSGRDANDLACYQALNVLACTFDGEGGTGDLIEQPNGFSMLVDNILYNTTGNAVGNTSPPQVYGLSAYNLFGNVGAKYQTAPGLTNPLYGYQDIEGDPEFTDEAGDNYTIQTTSPARAAGAKPGVIS